MNIFLRHMVEFLVIFENGILLNVNNKLTYNQDFSRIVKTILFQISRVLSGCIPSMTNVPPISSDTRLMTHSGVYALINSAFG
jgi:hypothetical protein